MDVNKDLIVGLPDLVLATLLAHWLELFEIARLESAYSCQKRARDQLLNVISSENVIFPNDGWENEDDDVLEKSILWVLRRQMHVCSLTLPKSCEHIPIGPRSQFFQLTGRFLKYITSNDYDGDLSTTLELISSYCPNVEELDISKSHLTEQFSVLLTHLPQLKVLQMEDCLQFENRLLESMSCLNLEVLTLAGCPGVDDHCMDVLSRRCTHLSSLDISECLLVGDLGISLIAHRCTELETLLLYNCSAITADGIRDIANHCVNLVKLDISYCFEVASEDTNVFLDLLLKCPALTTLYAHEIMTDGILIEVADAVTDCKIEKLRMSDCDISDEGICAITSKFTRLVDLDIGGASDSVTDASLFAIAKNCPRLKVLIMDALEDITDAGVIEIATKCHELEELSVCDNDLHVTMEGYRAVALHCEKLTLLGLDEINNWTKSMCHSIRPGLSIFTEPPEESETPLEEIFYSASDRDWQEFAIFE